MRQLLLGLSLCLAFLAAAAPSEQPTEIQQLQQQIKTLQDTVVQQQEGIQQLKQQGQTLEKDFSAFQAFVNARLDMQDKRVGDFGIATGQQANAIAVLGIFITFIALVAGFGAYFTATNRAIQEAEKHASLAAKEWFEKKGDALIKDMESLRKKTLDAQQQVQASAEEASQNIEKHLADAAQTAERLRTLAAETMQQSTTPTDSSTQIQLSQEAVKTLKDVSQALGAKPENDFTAEDHYTRGSAESNAGRFIFALPHFEKAIEKAATESIPESEQAKFMIAKCITLGRLKQYDEAIAVSDEIEKIYGNNNDPKIRAIVARALFNKGLRLGQSNPDDDADIQVYSSLIERYENDESLGVREQVAKALFNKGVRSGKFIPNEQEIPEYDLIIKNYGNDNSKILRTLVAQALVNKGYRLSQLMKSDRKDIEIFDSVVSRYSSDPNPELREQVAKALLNKGARLSLLGENLKAIEVLKNVVQEYENDSEEEIKDVVSNAKNVINLLYMNAAEHKLKKHD